MDFDISLIIAGINSISGVIASLKTLSDSLPDNQQKKEIVDELKKIELNFDSAKFESAKSLGYEICVNHFPPGIMISEDRLTWKCIVCGNIKQPRGSFRIR